MNPDLVLEVSEFSRENQVPIAFHLAESREELELLDAGTGPLVDFFRKMGFWRDLVIAPGSAPRDYPGPIFLW